MSSATFQSPHRPLGVRLYNWAGTRWSGLRDERRFDANELLMAAQRGTGLSDFGGDFFVEPLEQLLASYDRDARLTPFGRTLAWLNVRLLLRNRLRVRYWLKRHSEIEQLAITRPFIIAGLPRTGTTLLYNLLTQDTRNRPLLTWEAMEPAADPRRSGTATDPRIRRTRWIVKGLRQLAPQLMTIHPVRAEAPEECSRLLLNTFITPFAAFENHVPSYEKWYLERTTAELVEAYEDYKRQLQLLSWQRRPEGQWLLKSPAHTLGIQALLRVFPDARVILTHRDPSQLLPSLCSLFAVYRGISSDDIDLRQMGPELSQLCAEGVQRQDAARAEHEANICDVRYRDLVSDPFGTVRRIYEFFSCSWPDDCEQRARSWLAANPKDKHGVHRYELRQFGLDTQPLDETLRLYRERHEFARQEKVTM